MPEGGWQQQLDGHKLKALKLAAGLLRPKAAAALAATRLDSGNYRPGRKTVLCLMRPHFSLDVEQLRKLDRVNWLGQDRQGARHLRRGSGDAGDLPSRASDRPCRPASGVPNAYKLVGEADEDGSSVIPSKPRSQIPP